MLFNAYKRLYRLYAIIRSHYDVPVHMVWTSTISRFLQQSIILVAFLSPVEIFGTNTSSSFWHFVESIFLLLPWVFGTDDLLFDSIFFFVANLILLLIFFYCVYRANKYKQINLWLTILLRVYQQYVVGILEYPCFFRFSYLIQQFVNGYRSPTYIISFILSFINCLFILFHTQLASLFLVSMVFTANSILDVYDGKHNVYMLLVRFISTGSVFYATYSQNEVIFFVLISVVLILSFFGVYMRLSSFTHVTLYGLFFDISPIISCPFSMILHYFNQLWGYQMILLIGLYLIIIAALNIIKHKMIHQSLKAFLPFIKENAKDIGLSERTEDGFSTNIIFESMNAVIRIVSMNHCDPECFIRFLKLQKKNLSSKTSYTLEIIRYLALFPSRRKFCLKELKKLNTRSNFNSFTIYLFKKMIKAITTTANEERRYRLNQLYRSFIVHKFLYWDSRKNKQKFKAFKEAFYTCYYFYELSNELRCFLKYFSFDPYVHFLASEFMITGYGDFELYRRELTIAEQLEIQNEANFEDPWLHPMSIINPRILQYCNQNEVISALNNPPSSSKEMSSPFSSIFNTSSKSMKRRANQSKKSPIITFISPSRRFVPLLTVFYPMIPAILFTILLGSIYPQQTKIKETGDNLYLKTNEERRYLYKVSSAMFVPYQLNQQEPATGNCYQSYINSSFLVTQFYNSVPLISNLTSGMLYSFYRYSANYMVDNLEVCDLVDGMSTNISSFVSTLFYRISVLFQDSSNIISQLYSLYDTRYFFTQYLILGIICIVCFLIISFIIAFIQLNLIMNDDFRTTFLASEERVALYLMLDAKSAWELLRKNVSSDETSTDTGSTIHISETSTNIIASPRLDRPLKRNSAFSILSSTNETGRSMKRSSVIAPSDATDSNPNSSSKRKSDTTGVDEIIPDDPGQRHNSIAITSARSSKILDDDLYLSEKDLKESDFASKAIQITEIESKNEHILIGFLFILPTLILIIVSAYLIIPIMLKMNDMIKRTSVLQQTDSECYASLELMNITWRLSLGYDVDRDSLLRIRETLQNSRTEFRDIYIREQCYRIESVVCFSVDQIVNSLIQNTATQTIISLQYLPITYFFSYYTLITIFLSDVTVLYEQKQSNGICFLIAITAIMFSFIIVGIMISKCTMDAFNSLFHFPNEFLKSPSKKRKRLKFFTKGGSKTYIDSQNKKKVEEFAPTNILILTTITESDVIYNTSENSKQIINRGLNDLLGQKFTKLFTIIPGSNNICEYTFPDKKKKKFRFAREKFGTLTKTVLIEEHTLQQTNAKEKPYSQRLIEFIPPSFAKQFADNNISLFEFSNSYLISLRIKSTIPSPLFDKFVNSINHQSQNYKSLGIIHVDGNMLILATSSNIDPLIVQLFIRDLINDANVNAKGNKNNFPLYSCYIDFIPLLSISVNDSDEPFLEFQPSPNEVRFSLFHIQQNMIGFTSTAMKYIKSLKQETQKTKILNFTNEKRTVFQISFDDFSHHA